MRRVWRATIVAGLIVTAAAGTGRSQVPGAPVAAPPGAAPAAAVGAAGEKVGFIKRLCQGLDECKRKLCKSPAGKLLNGMTAPLTAMTGGVIPPFCPLMPDAKDLAKPGVAGAAAAAQKEALEAGERKAAVRFLGTLDCRYFPDAAVKLANALRGDSSECVRYEAALVLNRGCCCTELTVKALTASVSGTDADGFPAERSLRVRCAAALALEKCTSCWTPPPSDEIPDAGGTTGGGGETPPPKTMGETKPGMDEQSKKDAATPKTTLNASQRLPSKATIDKALKVLNEFNALLAAYEPVLANQPPGVMADRRSVYHLLKDSATVPESAIAGNPTPAAPVAAPKSVPSAMPSGLGHKAANPSDKKPTATEPAQAPKLLPVTTTSNKPTTITVPGTMAAPKAVPTAMPPAATTGPVSAAPTAPVQPAAALDPVNQQINRIARQTIQGATPADRHAAIRELVKYDWQQHPMVAAALLAGAKTDAVDVVRVDCLRHLAAHKMTHPQVLADLANLVNDSDPWVRQEAAAALSKLKDQ